MLKMNFVISSFSYIPYFPYVILIYEKPPNYIVQISKDRCDMIYF